MTPHTAPTYEAVRAYLRDGRGNPHQHKVAPEKLARARQLNAALRVHLQTSRSRRTTA